MNNIKYIITDAHLYNSIKYYPFTAMYNTFQKTNYTMKNRVFTIIIYT